MLEVCCYCTKNLSGEVSSRAENADEAADKAASRWVTSVGLFVLLLGVWLITFGVSGSGQELCLSAGSSSA